MGMVHDVAHAGDIFTFMLLRRAVRRVGKSGTVYPDALTKAFVKARNASTLDLGDNPPTFHEIRSLASRLYSMEKGEEFAQRLLGHKSALMTKKYLDLGGKEYVLV